MGVRVVAAVVGLALVVGVSACGGKQTETSDRAFGEPLDPDMQGQVLAVAADYRDWMPVYIDWRMALESCVSAFPQEHLMSKADSASPHGNKVYNLFASERDVYLALASANSDSSDLPAGFAVVKQAWTPSKDTTQPQDLFGLFMMLKVGPAVSDSDDGWIYAMVSPDGSVVHEAGRIESCMSCHRDAKHGRLFGPDPSYMDTGFPFERESADDNEALSLNTTE